MPQENIDYLSQNVFSKLANQKKYEINTGLSNLGNTCFMNSVYQLLFNIQKLNLYFLSRQYDKDKKVNVGVADAFRNLLLNINDQNSRDESLKNLKQAMGKIDERYLTYEQSDADVFFSDFLSCISRELNNSSMCSMDEKECETLLQNIESQPDLSNAPKELGKKIKRRINKTNLFLRRLFNCYTISFFYCDECENLINSSFDGHPTLNINCIDSNRLKNMFDSINFLKAKKKSVNHTLCKKCNKKVYFYVKQRLLNVPNYFFVRLDRESYENKNLYDFPVDDFCIGEYAIKKQDQDTKFRLIGVVCYSGNGQSGHYYSYCKKNDGWYYFSDSTVKKMPDDFKINEDKDIQNNVYFLLYEKKDMKDKDLFDGYDIDDFIDKQDKEDLKIISESNKIDMPIDNNKNKVLDADDLINKQGKEDLKIISESNKINMPTGNNKNKVLDADDLINKQDEEDLKIISELNKIDMPTDNNKNKVLDADDLINKQDEEDLKIISELNKIDMPTDNNKNKVLDAETKIILKDKIISASSNEEKILFDDNVKKEYEIKSLSNLFLEVNSDDKYILNELKKNNDLFILVRDNLIKQLDDKINELNNNPLEKDLVKINFLINRFIDMFINDSKIKNEIKKMLKKSEPKFLKVLWYFIKQVIFFRPKSWSVTKNLVCIDNKKNVFESIKKAHKSNLQQKNLYHDKSYF